MTSNDRSSANDESSVAVDPAPDASQMALARPTEDGLAAMPDSERRSQSGAALKQEARIFAATASFQGPWPPPEVMGGYASVDPSFPERIVKNWEQEAAHRRKLELAEFEEEERDGAHTRHLQWAGFAMSSIIGLAGVVGAFVFWNPWLLLGVAAGGGIGVGVRALRRAERVVHEVSQLPPDKSGQ